MNRGRKEGKEGHENPTHDPVGVSNCRTRQTRRLSGFDAQKGSLHVRPYGEIRCPGGYRIEKLIDESEPGIIVPALLFVPDAEGGRKPAAVYLHGDGKTAAAEGSFDRMAGIFSPRTTCESFCGCSLRLLCSLRGGFHAPILRQTYETCKPLISAASPVVSKLTVVKQLAIGLQWRGKRTWTCEN